MSDWSRRTFLTGVGTAVIAGCLSDSESPGDDTTETSPGSGSPTASETPTATATSTGPTETESPTETGTATPSPPEPPESIDSDWSLPAADAGRSKYNPDATGPTDPVGELWTVETGTTLFGPVVADGTLFAGGDDGTVRAFDARTGDSRWDASVGDAAGRPRVLDSRLFVPTTEAIVALSVSDGSELWRTDTPGRVGRRAGHDSVVWLPGMVVADHGVYWFDANSPAVVALSTTDGSQQWRTEVAAPAENPLFASEDRVFVSSGTHDNRFWRFDAETGEVLGAEPRGGADFPAEKCYMDGTMYAVDGFFGTVRATAVTDAGTGWNQGVPGAGGGAGDLSGGADHVFYTSNAQDEDSLWALSRTEGTVSWTADPDEVVTGRPAVAEETVLLPTEGGCRCYDPTDGTELWAMSDVEVGAEPVVVDDVVYAVANRAVRAFRPR